MDADRERYASESAEPTRWQVCAETLPPCGEGACGDFRDKGPRGMHVEEKVAGQGARGTSWSEWMQR